MDGKVMCWRLGWQTGRQGPMSLCGCGYEHVQKAEGSRGAVGRAVVKGRGVLASHVGMVWAMQSWIVRAVVTNCDGACVGHVSTHRRGAQHQFVGNGQATAQVGRISN